MQKKPIIDGANWLAKIRNLIDPSKPVLVYKNLHKNLFSVRQGTRVVCHVPYVFLRDPEFIVSKNGRERVRSEGQKNVHAFVKGWIASPRLVDEIDSIGSAYYNPYTCDTFILTENNGIKYPLHKAQFADVYIPSSIIVW